MTGFPLTLLAAVAAVAAQLLAPLAVRPVAAQPIDSVWIKANYRKVEARVPMRDGVKLLTSIYVPRDTAGKRFPFLMTRTPYSAQPYGEAIRGTLGPSSNPRFARDGYVFVVQDVRGRYLSEGNFTSMTPHNPAKKPGDVDESTDAYDTIEWLLKNVTPNNGRVGIHGGSWPGFYATASCIDAHPALVACSPQAPMTDVWMGDDNFHNGAFLLAHNFTFFYRFGRPDGSPPGVERGSRLSIGPDAYQYYLNLGPVGPAARRIMPRDSAPVWYEFVPHVTYDEYNKARDISRFVKNMKPAMLIVGGLFDTEDLAGPWRTWRGVERLSPNNNARIIVGPWSHGGWGRGDANALGPQRFGSASLGVYFRDSVEYPFFVHHLKGGPDPKLAEATVFETGRNVWRQYEQFPPADAAPRALYFHAGGKLSFSAPAAATGAAAYDSYVSDPMKPVPTMDRIEGQGMPRDYIVADQRYASRRPDVLTYVSDVLTEDITIAGPIVPKLHVATSGTDADFMVKLIDVQPDNAPNLKDDEQGFVRAGAQFLIRGEPFRARYRRSWEKPIPFTPNVPDSLAFEMPDVNHTFLKGHRIMVQVQSTWFPFVDRNPQTFVRDIFEAKPSDYKAATMRVYHVPAKASRIEVRTLR
ncbi:MAG TPA: X-Pro dipeptidyl-peptidase [Gemmatimonas aurantiaca]|nr:CocE/NonD family hydrolase [Gemmatimonas aurantiaca]HCT57641.1 X-Pro dipeptidyl-peptidase [Gemmatimonas aurantiaca]